MTYQAVVIWEMDGKKTAHLSHTNFLLEDVVTILPPYMEASKAQSVTIFRQDYDTEKFIKAVERGKF